jgi:hypothetical protein
MKSRASKFKDFIRYRFLEISSSIILVVLIVVLFFVIPDLVYAVVISLLLAFIFPALILITRRSASRDAQKSAENLLRAGDRHNISRPAHQDQSKYTSPGYVDIGPVADHGQPISVMISAAEVMHDDDVRKRKFYAKIGGAFDDYPAVSPFADFLAGTADVRKLGEKPSLDQVFEKNVLKFLEKVRQEIIEMGGTNVQMNYDENKTSFIFDFPRESKYALITGVVLNLVTDQDIVIEVILRKHQPFSLTLNKSELEEENEYAVISSFTIVKEGVLEKREIKQSLKENYDKINHIMIDKKYVTGNISDISSVSNFLDLVKVISSELLRIDIGILEIEELKCLNCGHKLETEDKECDSCGTKRPYCMICRLDLYASEEEDIVQTPCCGVYAHKLHMIMWLDNHQKCPNCQEVQTRWLDQLKDSY